MRDARSEAEADPSFPPIVFLYPGTPEQGEAFFGREGFDVPAVADPDGSIFEAFGLGAARWIQMFGPESLACGLRAASKGHGIGMPAGDVRRMPGAFLVEDGRVTWEHRPRHIGDQPRWSDVPRVVQGIG